MAINLSVKLTISERRCDGGDLCRRRRRAAEPRAPAGDRCKMRRRPTLSCRGVGAVKYFSVVTRNRLRKIVIYWKNIETPLLGTLSVASNSSGGG